MAAKRRRARTAAARPRVRWGRLMALALVLIAAALYAEPLRDYFVQQDRHQKAAGALETAQAENRALRAEVERLGTNAYIAEKARTDLQMVPQGMQAFVVKGLPGEATEAGGADEQAVVSERLSPFERLSDLWRTLSE
ncbi:MAG: septum formation initiator family protein [Thermoleophilia bacterium]|nr:septum formation initiator family protein [Thermoleophilia bacterium]